MYNQIQKLTKDFPNKDALRQEQISGRGSKISACAAVLKMLYTMQDEEKQKEEEVQRDSRVSDPDEYNELDENL